MKKNRNRIENPFSCIDKKKLIFAPRSGVFSWSSI